MSTGVTMTPDQWAIKHDLSRESINGVDPMDRIKWAMDLFKGRIYNLESIQPPSGTK